VEKELLVHLRAIHLPVPVHLELLEMPEQDVSAENAKLTMTVVYKLLARITTVSTLV